MSPLAHENRLEYIRAAHNLTIELSPTSWRLFNGSAETDPPEAIISLLEAREGTITASPVFAKARRLPADGQLDRDDVARVVVGWAPESSNWHLGLLLNPTPEDGGKLRWCGLASWPSGPASESVTQAKIAGQSLARIIDRPFRLVPPKGINGTLQRTQPIQPTDRLEPSDAPQPVTLLTPQAPPFEFEDWRFTAAPAGYLWRRPGGWRAGLAARAVVYLALAAGFLFLGAGTLTSGLAAVNPPWLPWVGVAVGIILAALSVRQVWRLLTICDVLLDTNAREVRCRVGLAGRTRWRVPFDAVEHVLVSQTPARAEGRAARKDVSEASGEPPPQRIRQKVWLHLYDGQRFYPVAVLEGVAGFSHDWEGLRAAQQTPGRRPLVTAQLDTPAHHAAQFMARTIGTDVWLDVA